jgi:hypothetical protein
MPGKAQEPLLPGGQIDNLCFQFTMKAAFIAIGILPSCLLTGCSWGPCGPHVITREEYREHREAKQREISGEDRAEIAAVVKLETDEPILMLNREDDHPELVRVNTGHSLKAINSSGKTFVLTKKKSRWVVIFRGTWAS